jgi:hypothetical protein
MYTQHLHNVNSHLDMARLLARQTKTRFLLQCCGKENMKINLNTPVDVPGNQK